MKRYILLALVFFASLAGALFLPIDELFKGIFSTPAVIALVGVLYQIMRDEAQHLKNVEIQRQQHFFNIGAMSHMANVAFDKHAEFCEKYMKEINETLSTLFREGPTQKTLEHAAKFLDIKYEYAAWITDDINKALFPFEQALRELGAAKDFATSVLGEEAYEKKRQDAVEKAWDKFNDILTIQGELPDEHIAIEAVKKKIREILDIEDLVNLRKNLIKMANADQ